MGNFQPVTARARRLVAAEIANLFKDLRLRSGAELHLSDEVQGWPEPVCRASIRVGVEPGPRWWSRREVQVGCSCGVRLAAAVVVTLSATGLNQFQGLYLLPSSLDPAQALTSAAARPYGLLTIALCTPVEFLER